MIDRKQIEAVRALATRAGAGAADVTGVAILDLLTERERLGRLALKLSRGYGAPGLVTCRECGRVAKLEELRASRDPGKLAHFPRCALAPWEDGKA